MGIIERILDKRTEYIKTTGNYPNAILIPIDDEVELFSCMEVGDNFPRKPDPPIKSKTEQIKSGGLFLPREYHSIVEYDHHAPEYLRQLKEYRERLEEAYAVGRKTYIFGMNITIDPVVTNITAFRDDES